MVWAYDAHAYDQAMLKRRTTGTMRWKKGTGPECGETSIYSTILSGDLFLNTSSFNRRYRTMESAANRLQKEAKGYLDSLRGRQASEPTALTVGGRLADFRIQP